MNRALLLAIAFCLCSAGRVSSAPLTDQAASALFEQGNKAYEQSRYSDAIAAYSQIAATGRASAAVLFNLGNAHFKAGQLGRAILNYRSAEQLAPRDREIRANLRFVQKIIAAHSPVAMERWWEYPVRIVTLNEVALALLICSWIWLGLLSAALIHPGFALRFRRVILFSGWSSAALICWLAAAIYLKFGREQAVVAAPSATIRYGPLQESQLYFTLGDGSQVEVLDRRNNWQEIKDAQDRVGWIREQQLLRIPEF